MKIYKRKGSPNWYLRQGDTLISLKTTRKAHALQLLEEYQAKRLGIYRVPHKKASAFFDPISRTAANITRRAQSRTKSGRLAISKSRPAIHGFEK